MVISDPAKYSSLLWVIHFHIWEYIQKPYNHKDFTNIKEKCSRGEKKEIDLH